MSFLSKTLFQLPNWMTEIFKAEQWNGILLKKKKNIWSSSNYLQIILIAEPRVKQTN